MTSARTPRAAIIGLSGPALTAEEARLLRTHPPAGAILFARNIQTPGQVLKLVTDIRALLGPEAPVLVDQEGGRVARLKPPHWPAFPPAARFENGSEGAAAANAALIGAACAGVGLDVACAPVLDLRLPGAHDVIGDRAFSADRAEVARLGRAWITGLHAAGVQSVIKHIPGHGRAQADSHHELPRVEAGLTELEADFHPFRALAGEAGWAMTAHILYAALDPDLPATLSPRIIGGLIRAELGFDGVLVSDDLAMKALTGTSNNLAVAAVRAGCDVVLHCTGRLDDNASLLSACPALTDHGAERLARARRLASVARPPSPVAA